MSLAKIHKNNSATTRTGHLEHPYNLRHAIERFERGYLQNILVLAGWDNVSASKMLGIQPKTLRAKLKKYELL